MSHFALPDAFGDRRLGASGGGWEDEYQYSAVAVDLGGRQGSASRAFVHFKPP